MTWRRVSLTTADILFTDRTGGVSSGPYRSANVGPATSDDRGCLAENRRRVTEAFAGFNPKHRHPWIWMDQVHGSTVLVVPGGSGSYDAPGGQPAADAAVTGHEEAALAIFTADCAPIALATPAGVGAVHAGWRGLSLGVIEGAVAHLQALGEGPIEAVLGPCIRPCCYEFGVKELRPLIERYGRTLEARTSRGALALDMAEGVRRALGRAGVRALTDVGICTSCSSDHFSYRRDGETGRQVMLVARRRGDERWTGPPYLETTA